VSSPVLTPSATGPTLPTILVVDDELGYREGIRRVLTGRGYRARAVGSAAEALELAAGGEFPIVLVDLKMPGIDGFELIRRLRERHVETLCVVVSAFATIESAVQTTKMGAFDFVVKPFAPDDLMAVVNRAAEAWRIACEAARLRAEREAHLLEIAAEKSRLRTILQAMGDGLLVVNIDGDIVLDNPAARRLLGQVQHASLAGPLSAQLADRAFAEAVQRLLGGQTTDAGAELEIRLPAPAVPDGAPPAGGERFLRCSLTPFHDGRGRVLGGVVLLSDVTDGKALEHAKTLFVSMVAHELKAPVGAVEGYLRLIESGAYEQQPGKLREIAARCLDRTGTLLALVQDLLEMTRRDAGRAERRLEPLDLPSLCRSLVEFHGPEAERRGIVVALEAEAALPPFCADRGEIERIVTNLLSNAIKYNRDGGRITVCVRRAEAALAIEVADTGIGMSPEELRRLGEEFFRAKNPRTRRITGTGLGLSLVKRIAQSYQGALEVESAVDRGTTVRVLFPIGASTEVLG
jgi:PAS domain S-box-containing protein